MGKATLGIIGGSGIYDLPGIEDVREERIDTPWGEPSDVLRIGRAGGSEVVFLPRHGRGHRLPPSEINYRANIDALKQLGVTDLVSFSACGSYREELSPGTFVLVDNFVDRTVRRESSFFGAGCVAHVSFAHPVGPVLQDMVARAAEAEAIPFRRGGTAVCMEGPQFSTLAESRLYRSWDAHVIGMTNMPEAKLAREAEICYATMALVTDYDVWHETEEDVNVESVVAILRQNAATARAEAKPVHGARGRDRAAQRSRRHDAEGLGAGDEVPDLGALPAGPEGGDAHPRRLGLRPHRLPRQAPDEGKDDRSNRGRSQKTPPIRRFLPT